MMRFTDNQMIRAGQAVIIAGIVILLLPFGKVTAVGGLILIGLGCAPVYPCIIHSTPANSGQTSPRHSSESRWRAPTWGAA